ncbi:hypothetical protein C8R43DRAFT_587161 [Mycena crocata]|nr:hypothetical protein C8R43DRAFT_587161 [Mycena crocata]
MVLDPASSHGSEEDAEGAEAESSATMAGNRRLHEMASLETEIEWHYAQIALLKAKRNSLAPICSLPNELLCRIFIIYAVESDTLFNLKWTQIMYVCHRWHDLAMATQPLWAAVQIGWQKRRIPRLFEQLTRSGAAPLTFKINPYEGYHTHSILANSGRVRSLELRGEAKKIYQLIRSLPECDFPILSSIDFDPTYKRDELPEGFVEALPDEIFDRRMPQLRELVLHSIALPWRSLRGITTLCLTDCGDTGSSPHTFDALLVMLAACPELHTLKLEETIPPPIPDRRYPVVHLSALAWIRLRDDATTCAVALNHLSLPPTASVHIFPYGVRAGPDIPELLIPIRKHLRAPGLPTPRLVHIEGAVRPESSHYSTSLFCDTASPDPLDTSDARCPFHLNSHPANEGELRRIMTKIFKALPFESITHLDVRIMTMTAPTWKVALKLLPALQAIYMTQLDDASVNFFGALSQIEQMDRAHRTFPRIQRLHIRVLSRARLRAFQGEPEEAEDFDALLLTPLRKYLRALFDNGNVLQVLKLEDRERCLTEHEREMDELFPLIGDRMVWNSVVYDPAKRKADREAWEVERRQLEIDLVDP